MIQGVDKSLYCVTAIKGERRVATIKVIAFSKLEAYYSCKEYFPKHDRYNYDHIRFVSDNEGVGVILSKNDKKRKK